MSRADLAGAVRDGRVSPRQLVEECLRRIEAANTNLNAVVSLRADAALAEADTHPRTGPLAGLPLLVKDLARTVGLPTTFGSHLYAEAPPDDVDDLFIAKLKRAGAIVVGKTNTPAFGHTGFTDNQVFGPTRNPWNLSRSPGGSSGGAGAALAAGLAPLATSSDGGGSVRIPAALCGLVGYKATNGAIGRGTLPRWLEFSSMGCTASTVADVLLEASVVMGAAPGDVISIPAEGVDIEPRLPSHLVACPTLRMGADDVIASAFSAAVDALGREIGVDVLHVESATSRECSKRWFTMATAELAQSLLEHRDRWTEFEPTLRQAVEIGIEIPMTEYVAAARERWAECARVDTLLGVDGVLLTPTVNSCAWVPEGPMPNKAGGVDDTWIALNTADFNFTGHPAINVPLGYDAVGVPFGLQIVAPRCRDGLAFGVAQVWERLQPWPEVAPGYQPFGID